MELRVWVDGTQRVVCGVKLNTTCEDIVFALAHATRQAGRFTMIERWRNNERLLSPNEQPLVTLQRWGEHMNEVEFILKKTSSEITPNTQINQAPAPQQVPQHQQQTLPQANPMTQNQQALNQIQNNLHKPVKDEQSFRDQPVHNMSAGGSPSDPLHNLSNQSFDNLYQHHHYNHLTRRPQTVLGHLNGSNSTMLQSPNYLEAPQQQLNRLHNPYRTSISTSTLPNMANIMNAASPLQMTSSMTRPSFADDHVIMNRNIPRAVSKIAPNGYQSYNDNRIQPNITSHQQQPINQYSNNLPVEDLYSTVNKKRTNQIPPAVPAKPLASQIPPVAKLDTTNPNLTAVNSAQINYYYQNPNQTTYNNYSNNLRPRNPPGYLEYLESITRSQVKQPTPNTSFPHGNAYQRSFDNLNIYNNLVGNNRPSQKFPQPAANHRYSLNGVSTTSDYERKPAISVNNSQQDLRDPIHSPALDQLITTNDSTSSNLSFRNHSTPTTQTKLTSANTSGSQDISMTKSNSLMSKMGHDMLKVIEEQKQVLINQKNELDRLDNDQEYWESRWEQIELVKRIEDEIQQLEKLWKENQVQIKKLENQDFDKELDELKAEQVKMELEVTKQKSKLRRCENDIALCKSKIDQLEGELANVALSESESDAETGPCTHEFEVNDNKPNGLAQAKSDQDKFNTSLHLAKHPKSNILYNNFFNIDPSVLA